MLLELGVQVTVANRTRERAEALARELPGLRVIDWDARDRRAGGSGVAGQHDLPGHGGSCRRWRSILTGRASGLAVADIVYVPLETPLLGRRAGRGRSAASMGLGMLLYQAVPGFRAWFGVEPVVDDALRRFVAADLLPA